MHTKTGAFVLGLDIGGTQARAALADERQIIASRAVRWPPDLSPRDEVFFVADLALRLAAESGAAGLVRAAGVSLAALVDDAGAVADWPNRPSWRGLPFRALLEERLALPSIIEDDANAAALAEWKYGAGREYQNFMMMTVGTGVGAGLILDGRLHRGRHGWAGELGHVVVLPGGPACPCGHRGCLQTVASGRALERAGAERGLPDAEAVAAAARGGEGWAVEELAACGRWLGLAAANAVNLLDLEAVVVGGGLSTLGGPWWSAVGDTLRANLVNGEHRRVDLVKAALPETAGLWGAVGLAWQIAGPEGGRARKE